MGLLLLNSLPSLLNEAPKARIEKELFEKQCELAAAKAESIKAADRLEELLEKATKAMSRYRGDDEEEGGEFDDEY